MIGDPDGKSQERELLSLEQLPKTKAAAINEQYHRICRSRLRNRDNYDWFQGMNYLDFAVQVGKHVPIRQMLGRDFVQSRLARGFAW